MRVHAAAAIALVLLLPACGDDDAVNGDATTTVPAVTTQASEAPRANMPLFPGAALVKERSISVVVDEVYAVAAELNDVLRFYAELPGFESNLGGPPIFEGGGGRVETELYDLTRLAAPEAEIRAEIEAAGPLMILEVLPHDSPLLQIQYASGELATELPPGTTVIVMTVFTG